MKIVGIISTVIVTLVAATQIYDWVFRGGPDVTLDVQEYPIVYPETFYKFFETVGDLRRLSDAVLERRTNASEDDGAERKMSPDTVAALAEIPGLMPRGLPSTVFGIRGEFHRFVSIRISNDGSKRAQNLILKLVPLSYVRITPVGADSYVLDGSLDRIEIGDLLPGESISVDAWDTASPESYTSRIDDIVVFYDGGYTDADVHKMVPSFWATISENSGFILFMLALATTWILGVGAASYAETVAKRKKAAGEAGAGDDGSKPELSEESKDARKE